MAAASLDQVVARKEFQCVGRVEPDVVEPDIHERVQGRNGVAGGLDFRPAHIRDTMDDLALEVAEVDVVVIDDAKGADPRGGEVEQRRGAEATGTDHQDFRVLEASLADRADLRNDQVPRVAFHLVRTEVRSRVDQRSGLRIQLRLGGCGGTGGGELGSHTSIYARRYHQVILPARKV